jgi:hypothetical protein
MVDAIKDLMASTSLPGGSTPAAPATPAPTGDVPAASAAPAIPAPVATPAPATPVAPAPAPAEPEPTGPVHKKVISPITDPNAAQPPDLTQLLAKEGITDMDDDQLSPTAAPAPATLTPTAAPASPAPPTSAAPVTPPPTSPPAPLPTTASEHAGMPTDAHPPGHVISPDASSDPNRIAL